MDNTHPLNSTSEFIWGVGISAHQTEGIGQDSEKGRSIWDDFEQRGKIKDKSSAIKACDFYNRYKDDIEHIRWLGLKHFKTSISWPRIFPNGKGQINWKGLSFYDRLTDQLLENNIEPWYVLYHWDLPSELQKSGGWANRDIIQHYLTFAETCSRTLGDRVNKWMVFNEPFVFTGAGYFLGVHAPGNTGLAKFLPAVHHVNLATGMGIKLLQGLGNNQVGTALSFASIHSASNSDKDLAAASRVHSAVNRLFIDPLIEKGYPDNLSFLSKMDKYIQSEDMRLISCNPDFLGVQVYTREVIKHSPFVPYLKAKIQSAKSRNMPTTNLGQEVYPNAVVETVDWLSNHLGQNEIPLYITECGISCDESNLPTLTIYTVSNIISRFLIL